MIDIDTLLDGLTAENINNMTDSELDSAMEILKIDPKIPRLILEKAGIQPKNAVDRTTFSGMIPPSTRK